MRKNRMMRLASALLILTMVTTCAISGTFAKYVSADSATDTARVAKWGVTVTATGKNGESDAFLTSYDATAATKTVVAAKNADDTTDDIIAPGTKGDLGSITISGTPEVMVDIAATAVLTLEGWEIGTEEYCPLVFTVAIDDGAATTYKIDKDDANMDSTAELVNAVQNAVLGVLVKDDVAPNTPLDKKVAITWEWPIDGNAANASNVQTDVKDTALGDQAATATAATITLATSATVTQVD